MGKVLASVPLKEQVLLKAFGRLMDPEHLHSLYGWAKIVSGYTLEPGTNLEGVDFARDGRILKIALQDAGLNGCIPITIGHASELQLLDLRDNPNLVENIPEQICSCGNLEAIILTRSNIIR
jgi:hypothetical protein